MKITTEQILNLDMSKREDQKIMQVILKQIRPLSKYEDEVPFEKIEKTIVVLQKKYNFRISNIVLDIWSNENQAIYRATIIDDRTLKLAKCIYGMTIYELYSKVAVYLYIQTRK